MIPKFHEFFTPVLNLMANSTPIKRNADEIINAMLAWAVKNYSVTDEEVTSSTVFSSARNVVENRVGWAFTYLKQADLIEKAEEKFHYKITQAGLDAIKTNPNGITLKWLKENTPFEKNRKTKEKEINQVEENATEEDFNLDEYIEEIKAETKREFIGYVRKMDWRIFENFCLDLLQKMGYGRAEYNTIKVADGGIDGKIYGDKLNLETIYLQAKRYGDGNKVSPKDMKEFCYNVGDGKKGVFITTSHFSEEAKRVKEGSRSLVALIDIDRLFDLCEEYEHYLKKVQKEIVKPHFPRILDEDMEF